MGESPGLSRRPEWNRKGLIRGGKQVKGGSRSCDNRSNYFLPFWFLEVTKGARAMTCTWPPEARKGRERTLLLMLISDICPPEL